MATQESMAIRCNTALDRIEESLSVLLGADLPQVPRLHRDRDMLRVIQLEAIASYCEQLANAEAVTVASEAPVTRKK